MSCRPGWATPCEPARATAGSSTACRLSACGRRLVAVADKAVTEQLSQSRAVLDFFVALIALFTVMIPVTAMVVIWSGQWGYLLWLVPLVGLLPVW